MTSGKPGNGAAPHGGDGGRRSAEERAVRTCPNCGAELVQRSCKLACPDPACGFFLSCADYV